MKNNRNKNLFWYGVKAKLKQGLGVLFIMFSFLGLFISGWVALILIGIGIYFIFVGKSERFDYQRQSGYIMHRGD